MFYGRPAYRSNFGTKFGEPTILCPVCFVFKPRTVSRAIHRVYPCDSGAVAGDRFVPEIKKSDLADLSLDPQISSARKLVSLLFDTNGDYFFGKVVTAASFTAGTIEARFYDLLCKDGPADYDDRKSAIEVQLDCVVDLRDHLSFVVLPREFLDDANIRDAIINTWNCEAVKYPTFKGAAPAEYYSVVRQKVAEYYEKALLI